jgi:hypothetical protein
VSQLVGEVGNGDALGPAPLAPDAQHRLLRHHPADEEDCRRLPEQRGHLGLQPADGALVAVPVPLVDAELLGRSGEQGHRLGRTAAGMPDYGVVTGLGRGLEPFVELLHGSDATRRVARSLQGPGTTLAVRRTEAVVQQRSPGEPRRDT